LKKPVLVEDVMRAVSEFAPNVELKEHADGSVYLDLHMKIGGVYTSLDPLTEEHELHEDKE